MVLFNIILLFLATVEKRNKYKEKAKTISTDMIKKESIHKVEN